MSQASFVHTGGSITFTRSPRRPDNSLDVVQPQRTGPGGVRFGFAQTIVAAVISLPLRLTTAEKDALLVFFNTTANGMADQFIYTTTDGSALPVRFATPKLDGLTEVAYDAWTVTVQLRVVA